ncbi:MAG: alkaline phosphatase family protein [Bacteroidetes bacterium]|nr:alkaline phosphatase family protein [Bacteroidota bacterium]
MKHTTLIVVFLLSIFTVSAQHKEVKRPKLVVGIVVDQMRWDYLYKFYNNYGEGGFKRLINQGYNCQNTFINYLPSYTGPGHACIYTGSVPAIHGIASNDWIDNNTGKTVYCVEDKTVQAVGGSSKAGQMSPRNLLATTVGDELKLSDWDNSRVYSFSIKDRGAILPAGHSANGAFWFDDSTGSFMTSTYYSDGKIKIPEEFPLWLTDFNNKRWADSLIKIRWDFDNANEKAWLHSNGKRWYLLRDNEDPVTEGTLPGEIKASFPHNTMQDTKGYNKLRYLPGGNTIVFKAAKACVRGEYLGTTGYTDMLCISLSTTDYVGHTFGPDSREIEDMYYRLDEELASFLKFLDRQIGGGNYTIFLTADHGAAHNSLELKYTGIPAGNKSEKEAFKELTAYIKKATGKDSVIKALADYQVYLNENKITPIERETVKKLIVDWFYKQEGVAYAIDMENMQNENIPEPIKTMIVNGYNKQRSGCIQIILQPGWYSDSHKTGTTHGTWNPYDTHIPLLWYGWGIPHGETYRHINMTDIAATLSALLHIQMPNGCVGNVITEITDK